MSNTTASCLIFGATGGIGQELVRRLVGSGARVVAVARGKERLDALAGEYPGLVTHQADATTPDGVAGAFAAAAEAFGGPPTGVTNLVGSLLLKPAHLTTDADWSEVIAQNLTTAFLTVREAARTMTGGGSVVLSSSVAARVGLANHEGIAAAKAGVHGLALAAASTYASRGLRFNVVAPGLVRTPLTARLTSSEAALKASTAMHPLGRIGEPQDAAAAFEFLLHPSNTWITGQILSVDGGLSTVRGRA
jgi:NAD(P)-dependent dehydrogenase (short-subunit alcohol dehydrogenase family)